MSASICKQTVDTRTKMAITTLVDSFGHFHIVQTPMLSGLDHSIDVAREMAELNRADALFIAALTKMGKTDEEIDELKKSPNDCGCGGSW